MFSHKLNPQLPVFQHLSIYTGLLLAVAGTGNAQNVVINKYLNGSPDMVELLVIGDGIPGSTVNMEGMLIKDFSANMASDAGGKYTFNDVPEVNAVKAGTLVVLTSTGESADTDGADFVMQLSLADAVYFTKLSGTFDIATTDMITLKEKGSSATGTSGAIHTLGAGVAGAQYTGAPAPKLLATGNTSTGRGVWARNTTAMLADFNGTDAIGANLLAEAFGMPNPSSPGNEDYIRQLRGTVNVDGAGIALVQNTTSGSPANGKNYFARNVPQKVGLAINSTASNAPLTQISITLPTAFGVPVAGNVNVTGAGRGTAGVSVAGQVISLTGLAVTVANGINVELSGLTMPNPVGVADDGRYAFSILTAGVGGTLTAISAQPVALVAIPIANVRDLDTGTGLPLDNNKTVALEGVCTEENFGGTFTSAFVQDGVFGINVFVPGTIIPLTRATRYGFIGTIIQFRGLTEITPGSVDNIIDFGAAPEPAALELTLPQLMANPEAYESRVIRVMGLSIQGGSWAAGNAVQAADAGGNMLNIRIQAQSQATTAPTAAVINVTGILGQNNTTATPPVTVYELLPRTDDDVQVAAGDLYTNWAAFHGVGAPEADDDGDGLKNLVEYALGGLPKDRSSAIQPVVSGANRTVTFSKGAAAITDIQLVYTVEGSTNLRDWNVETPLLVDGPDNGGATVQKSYTGLSERFYFRLKVTR